jgi:hypothetical protein
MEITVVDVVTVEYRECVKCATTWGPVRGETPEECPVCETLKAAIPEGLIAFNLSKEDLVNLAAICSYWKNTNAFPSQSGQRVAAIVIERSRGY